MYALYISMAVYLNYWLSEPSNKIENRDYSFFYPLYLIGSDSFLTKVLSTVLPEI